MNTLPNTESQTVEFKTTFNDEVIVSLVAFANAKGGAVYVGVADDAYLLFKANNTSIGTTIEPGRFQDIITIKDTSRTKSDIITQVNEVIDFVKKHINLEVIITGEAQNIQKWQYPMEAIREIVLNMIIHRDYCAIAEKKTCHCPNFVCNRVAFW
jgi:predicted HTH transcriptional regulator